MKTSVEAHMMTRLHNVKHLGKILEALIVMIPLNSYLIYVSFDERL